LTHSLTHTRIVGVSGDQWEGDQQRADLLEPVGGGSSFSGVWGVCLGALSA